MSKSIEKDPLDFIDVYDEEWGEVIDRRRATRADLKDRIRGLLADVERLEAEAVKARQRTQREAQARRKAKVALANTAYANDLAVALAEAMGDSTVLPIRVDANFSSHTDWMDVSSFASMGSVMIATSITSNLTVTLTGEAPGLIGLGKALAGLSAART